MRCFVIKPFSIKSRNVNVFQRHPLQIWNSTFWAPFALLFLSDQNIGQHETTHFEARKDGSWLQWLETLWVSPNLHFQSLVCALHFLFLGASSWWSGRSASHWVWAQFKRPLFKGGALRYLSKECRKPRRVDFLYGSPNLFLASA